MEIIHAERTPKVWLSDDKVFDLNAVTITEAMFGLIKRNIKFTKAYLLI